MLNEKYKVGKKIPIKDLIPRELKPADKKKIKDNVKSCVLTYQITGEEIPSVINSEYNVQAIQFYDFELVDMKKVAYIANLYQGIIKSPCVLRLHDSSKEVYSLALKRLNQNDGMQITVTDTLITKECYVTMPSAEKKELESYIALDNLVGKQDKVTTYLEMYVKVYILTKDKVYTGSTEFLERQDFWYSESKVRGLYADLRALELLRLSLSKASGNVEKVRINKEIREITKRLNEVKDGR